MEKAKKAETIKRYFKSKPRMHTKRVASRVLKPTESRERKIPLTREQKEDVDASQQKELIDQRYTYALRQDRSKYHFYKELKHHELVKPSFLYPSNPFISKIDIITDKPVVNLAEVEDSKNPTLNDAVEEGEIVPFLTFPPKNIEASQAYKERAYRLEELIATRPAERLVANYILDQQTAYRPQVAKRGKHTARMVAYKDEANMLEQKARLINRLGGGQNKTYYGGFKPSVEFKRGDLKLPQPFGGLAP